MKLSSALHHPSIITLGSVSSLLLAVAFLVMGNGLQGTLVPIRAGMEGFASINIGLMGFGYYAGFILGCLYTPRLMARVGHIRTFTALVAIASIGPLANPVLISPFVWILLRGMTGFCLAGLYLIIESWLNEKAENGNRGFVMSSYIVVNFSVITIGQLLVMAEDPSSFVLFTVASILISLSALPIALTTTNQPTPPPVTRFRPKKLYQISPVGMVGCVLIGLGQGAFWTLAPVFAIAQGGGSIAYTSLFMSAAVMGGALAQTPLGRLSDKIDRRLVLMAICFGAVILGAAITLLGVYHITLSFSAGLFLASLFGACTLPAYALAAAHAFDFADRKDFVELSGGLLLANGVGSALGPVIASGLMGWFGEPALFGYHGGVMLILAGYLVHRLRQRASATIETKQAFDLGATAAIPTVHALPVENVAQKRRRFRALKVR
ncbi:MAG: MFS transporter [Alphaproteobacteria bacterium CG_4_10_14_0_8_um_filter_53_9]|nr:MAG: MFS transporter [Alphaproteobacteria bacterium CG_4_10_14_0_8_um_filter_53_9]